MFLSAPAAAVAAAQVEAPPAPPDSVTNPAGLEYFLLGNGKLLAGVQWTQSEAAGAQAGIVLMSPEHMNRKTGSLLWHPRLGLQATRIIVEVDGKPYSPEAGRAEMQWEESAGPPVLKVRWTAGACDVTERLWCAGQEAALIREVALRNAGGTAVEARVLAVLRPNPLLFDEYEVDRAGARLEARGYHHLELMASSDGRALEREIEVKAGTLAAGGRAEARYVLTLDKPSTIWTREGVERARADAAALWRGCATAETGDAGLDGLFRSAVRGLRSVVAESGKMDGGLWGYNLEWVRDASMAAGGAVLAGHADVGERMLERIVSRMISENGAALDSSFHRPPETIELDQNGQLLCTLWTHWVWTGSDALIRRHWPRIRATADFALDPVYRDRRTGLVKNTREFWERSAGHGVREGYELTYQCWNIAGWRRAAEMAGVVGDEASAARWLEAAALMERSFLSDARFSFIRDGRLVKRLQTDGEPQWTLEPPRREALPPGMPLRVEPVSYCNPDASNVYPILLGLVSPESEVARRTLESMEALWNQRWDIGGYGRYHVTGEPDSPGPWPFASLFIARAYLEAGDSDRTWRVLRWLESVSGGRSGAWFEYYGPRPVPPLPPVAVIPWTWAEIVTLVVHHVLGVRPHAQGVTVRPKLLEGLKDVRAALRMNGHAFSLRIRSGMGREAAFVDGREIEFRSGEARMARPQRDTSLEIWTPGVSRAKGSRRAAGFRA